MKKRGLKLTSLLSLPLVCCTLITPLKSEARISTQTKSIIKSTAFLTVTGISAIYTIGTGVMIAEIIKHEKKKLNSNAN